MTFCKCAVLKPAKGASCLDIRSFTCLPALGYIDVKPLQSAVAKILPFIHPNPKPGNIALDHQNVQAFGKKISYVKAKSVFFLRSVFMLVLSLVKKSANHTHLSKSKNPNEYFTVVWPSYWLLFKDRNPMIRGFCYSPNLLNP